MCSNYFWQWERELCTILDQLKGRSCTERASRLRVVAWNISLIQSVRFSTLCSSSAIDLIIRIQRQYLNYSQLCSGDIWLLLQIELQEPKIIIKAMNREFETSFKKRSQRERFYSSMNYEEYCDLFGLPAPLFKPQEDPVDDIPLLDLEQDPQPSINHHNQTHQQTLSKQKMETIPEIDGSENFTQNLQRSPKLDVFGSNTKTRELMTIAKSIEAPKRMRVRMRSQSDNSQYLIFNFLQRSNENGRKKRKIDQ